MSADQRADGWNALYDPFGPDDLSTAAASLFRNVTEIPSTTRERVTTSTQTEPEPDSDEDGRFIRMAVATLSAVRKRRREEDDDGDLIDVVLEMLESAKKKRRC